LAIKWRKKVKSSAQGSTPNKPFVSISNKNFNKIYLNSTFLRDKINNADFVKIALDEEKKEMYITEADPEEIHAVKISQPSDGIGAMINGIKLIEKITEVAGVPKGEKYHYEIKKHSDNIFYTNFNEPLKEGEVENE
jgi:hypothetical protein